jgi:molybdopterin-containing oxidoreductase family membrane subunit
MRRALQITTRIAILLVTVILFFTAWNFIVGLAGSETKVTALRALISGSYAFNFWALEIAIGMVIPLVLFIRSGGKRLGMMALASGLMLFGIFFMRYDLVIVGQIVPLYQYLNVTEYQGLISYRPTIHEILVVLGGVGVTGFLFLLGEKVFNGHKSEAH